METREALRELLDGLSDRELETVFDFVQYLRWRGQARTEEGQIVELRESAPGAPPLPRVISSSEPRPDPLLQVLLDAPDDDEPLTPEDRAVLEQRIRAARQGDLVSDEGASRRLGF